MGGGVIVKITRIFAIILAFATLLSVCCISASAEGTINFTPVLKGGKFYGTALNTPQSAIRALYAKRNVVIYDAESQEVPADSDVLIGTGFTVKLDGKNYYSAIVRGDIDGDGQLTQTDYVLIKRACLGTFKVSSLAKEAACVEPGGELRAINYIKVKRAYFGTYDINKEYTCTPYDPSEGNTGDGWSQGWV